MPQLAVSYTHLKYGKEVADNTSILYGGSCKPSNAKELFANPDVDGGLIAVSYTHLVAVCRCLSIMCRMRDGW